MTLNTEGVTSEIETLKKSVSSRFVIAAVVLVLVFWLDLMSSPQITASPLYTVVILALAPYFYGKQLVLLSTICVVLAQMCLFWSDSSSDVNYTEAMVLKSLTGMFSIAAATFVVARWQTRSETLKEQIKALEQTHDAIIIRDTSYKIKHWNQGASRLLGWRSEEAVGKKCYKLLQTTRFPTLAQAGQELFATGRWEGEEIYQHKNGDTVYVTSRWSLQKNARGQVEAIISASNDITAVRLAENALKQSQVKLAQVMRISMLGELVATIAHEINQPLAAISAHGAAGIRWLEHRPPHLEEVALGIRQIIRDADRASEVIKRIRALSNKSEIAHTSLDLDTVIVESLSLIEHEAKGRQITLLRCQPNERFLVQGDKVQLQQVIINLVINAIQAVHKQKSGLREIKITSRSTMNATVEVVISDTGPGLLEEDLSTVFDAFFTKKNEGLGLGLSICKSIVESHGGTIHASNNKPHGAEFRFFLPIRQAVEHFEGL